MSEKQGSIRRGRSADPEDCAAIAEINNLVYPEFPETAEELMHRDRKREEDMADPEKPIKWARWLWEEDGRVLGNCSYSQSAWMYHPRKFDVWVIVHPEHRERGIGASLYEHVMAEVSAFEPVKLSTWICPEKTPASPAFLENRGWKAGMKVWDSKLDLTSWDPAPFMDAVARVEEQGIRFTTYDELSRSDPDYLRKLYEMEREIWQDVPLPDKQTDPGLDWYVRHVTDSPNLYPEAWHLAMDGDRPVGLSCLWKQKSGEHLSTGLTGTARSHRRRGIAMGLKVKALSFAKGQGHPWVMTDNEENNVGMVGINKRLGFVDYPSWRGYEMILGEDEA
jgi:GNAT superfamily N-acetyltransferase